MRYFKLVGGRGWGDFESGKIYPENFYDTVANKNILYHATEGYARDWKEVSEEEYLKQEGMLSDLSKCSFYDKELTLTLEEIKRSLGLKSGEYASTGDKFHNFNEGAIRLKCTPERCLEAYNTKHLVSYADMLDKLDDGVIPSNDYIDEKLGDIINYFILQKIQLKQRNNK